MKLTEKLTDIIVDILTKYKGAFLTGSQAWGYSN